MLEPDAPGLPDRPDGFGVILGPVGVGVKVNVGVGEAEVDEIGVDVGVGVFVVEAGAEVG